MASSLAHNTALVIPDDSGRLDSEGCVSSDAEPSTFRDPCGYHPYRHHGAVELAGHDRAEGDDRVGLEQEDRGGRCASPDRLGEHARGGARAPPTRHHE